MTGEKVEYCGPYRPHIGETLTANYLEHHLPDDARILVNYYLPDSTGSLEVDLVVINTNGVYLLEVKHWSGKIKGDQTCWQHSSGDQRDNPIPIIEYKARVMHGFLKSKGWGYVSTAGLVVLSKGIETFHSTGPLSHKVFGRHQSLIDALTGPRYIHPGSSKLTSRRAIQRLRQVLLDSHLKDAERYVDNYRILGQRDCGHYVELEADDPEFSGRRKVRIKQYDVPEVGSEKEIEAAVTRFKRDMAALVEAGSHPNLVMPHKFHRDKSSDERYYLILEWPGGQTLTERIAAESIPMAEQLHILKSVAAALAHCHQRGVIHRNINPTSIYLYDDGRVKVGDFDFARLPAVTHTLRQTGAFFPQGRHVSAEVAFSASDVDGRADIFSLGAVWYDMLFRPEPDEALDRDRIETAPLPDEGKEVLRMMVAEVPSERPASMEEIHRIWLPYLE